MGNVIGIQLSCDAIFSSCLNCTLNKAAYVSQLEDNLAALHIEFQKLMETKNDVMTRVSNAEQQQMRRLHKVQGWLSRVEAVETEVAEFIIRDSSQEIDKLCLGGYCSKNCNSSFKFGKQVSKMLQLVDTLMGEGTAFEVVAEKVPEPAVDQRPCEMTVGLESTFDKVWRCLGEEQVGMFGLYGMGGVGKTTLLTQINNKFLHTPNDFDVVIWVVVSKHLQLEKIQETIGRRIGCLDESWKNRSLEDKASEIFRILSKKKFLLLMDDIWERVDLTKVGVPFPESKNTASKIVFTTRFLEICGAMKAHECLKVECLGPEDAWRLFHENLQRDVLDSHPEIPELAKIVAQECAGLPLALITIGRAMACKKTSQEWHHAIRVLRRSASEFPGMGKEVYPLLKFSYDNLPDDIIRSCLLYCSLFPEDYRIRKSKLIDCWIGEGFLDQYDRSGAYNEGYYIIGILLHACLLEEEEGVGEEEQGEQVVKMHDVIRDMVLWIACKIEKDKEKFLVHAGFGLTEAPEVQNWKDVRRMSLMKNKIENLSETPTCPRLVSLFVSDNSLKMITGDFFQFMPSLRVFNMSNNHLLWKLPSGISRLVSLEHLDLSSTTITHLPIELQTLVKLKCLNLEYMYNLKEFPRQVISEFSKLQVLRMFDCGGSKIERLKSNVLFGGHEILVEELVGMKHLNVLTITLKSWQALQELLISQELQRCTQALFLRCFNDSKSLDILCLADLHHLNRLYVAGCKHLEDFEMNVQRSSIHQAHGFHSLHTVKIGFCFKLKDLTWLVFAPNLKFIAVSSCYGMEQIIKGEKLSQLQDQERKKSLFAKLQFLHLENLRNLCCISWEALAFPHLKKIRVEGCPMRFEASPDSNSSKEHKVVIEGEENWWKILEWESQATQNAFISCFKPINQRSWLEILK